MRRILAISMAAAVPAIIPASSVDARTRPAPPTARHHHRALALKKAWRSRPPVPPQRRDARGGLIGAPGNVGAPGASQIDEPPAGKGGAAVPRTGGAPMLRAADVSAFPVAPPAGQVSPSPAPPSTAPSTSPSAAAPSQATGGPRRSRAYEPTRLLLKVSVGSSAGRSVTLRCDPPGGTHPKAAQACADLARSHGDFTVRSHGRNPRACFMIYSPVTAHAEGRYRGENVQFTARFPNTCVMRGQTGAIFDF